MVIFFPYATLGDEELSIDYAVNAARDAGGTIQEPPENLVEPDGAIGLHIVQVLHRLHAVSTSDQLML